MDKAKIKEKIIPILYVIASILFVLPSIMYYKEKGTILNFNRYYEFLLNGTDTKKQTIVYLIILAIITTIYFLIIKNRKKIFKNIKNILIYVAIIAIIFTITIPFVSSDIFYYLGIGRLNSSYNQNPYYTTIKEYVDENNINLEKDTVLQEGYNNVWSGTTVVYGPVWTLICRIVAMMSFGNIDIGLALFKMLNVLIHVLNCYLIYKLSNKKLYALLYGLNPFILLEAIAFVHNDIYIIFFMLLSFYFLLKKKNLVLAIIFTAIATAIKYFPILFLPFIIIYYFRKEKPSIRLEKCIKYALLFMIIIAISYSMYIRNMQVFAGIATQNDKIAKGIYVVIRDYFSDIPNIIENVKFVLLGSFTIIYASVCIVLLNKKEIKFSKEIKKANYFIIAFLFLLITNFQPWYIMWLYPCLIWQKSDIIKTTIGISILSQFSNSIFLMYNENWHYGTPFIFTLILGALTILLINEKQRKERIKNNYIRREKIG